MRRAILALVGTVAGLVILLAYKTAPGQHGARPVALSPIEPGGRTTPPTTTPPPSTTPSRKGSGPPKPTDTQAPRKVTANGPVINTQYGPVQVRVVLTGGHLTDVSAIQLPSDSPHSQQISSYARPLLRQEALAAGSAHIDIVSGATYTSTGYAQSLQAAIDSHHG
ncbi:MAG TPA: FMN-binding protein [Mycobacteriales bacterium]|jgi:hypothetical protein|nr:FMN-binding protein [Mycobacteriales bacterium]